MFFSRQIHQFIAIARTGSFIKAASEISLTPSALSHGIHELEQRLGKKLIVRKKYGAFLTRYGKKLYGEIAPLYDMGIKISNRAKSDKPKIVICVDGLLNPSLPKKLSYLFDAYGDSIEVISSNSLTPLADVIDEKCDVLLDASFGLENNTLKNLYKIALPPERIGIIASDKIKNKYKNAVSMLKGEKIFQSNTSLQHKVFRKFKEMLSANSIESTFIGLPDIFDVIGELSLDMGISIVSDRAFTHPAFSDVNFNFIELPPELDFIINRALYFKRERFDELDGVLTCIQKP